MYLSLLCSSLLLCLWCCRLLRLLIGSGRALSLLGSSGLLLSILIEHVDILVLVIILYVKVSVCSLLFLVGFPLGGVFGDFVGVLELAVLLASVAEVCIDGL